MSFEENGYFVLKNAFPKELCKFIEIQFKLLKTKTNGVKETVINCYSLYSTLFGEALLLYFQNNIQIITKKKLIPTYSFSRIYYNDSVLPKHTDRESCQYSASVCIKNDKIPWDLWIEDKNKNEISVKLEEGDVLIYKGIELKHWRNKYEGNEQIQVFLHYVDANDKYSEYAFDKRKQLYEDK
jgi:hypothetical protein